jgi:excisionase family DNA binding protein
LVALVSKYRRGLPMQQEPKKIERIFYTFQEAQEFLNVSHDTIYKLMKQGLPSHKIGRKRVFLIEDLIRWIKEH